MATLLLQVTADIFVHSSPPTLEIDCQYKTMTSLARELGHRNRRRIAVHGVNSQFGDLYGSRNNSTFYAPVKHNFVYLVYQQA